MISNVIAYNSIVFYRQQKGSVSLAVLRCVPELISARSVFCLRLEELLAGTRLESGELLEPVSHSGQTPGRVHTIERQREIRDRRVRHARAMVCEQFLRSDLQNKLFVSFTNEYFLKIKQITSLVNRKFINNKETHCTR